MELSLFDLHCDTPYEMLQKKQPLTQNQLAVSLENASCFRQYIQVMAFWTDCRLDDEAGWQQYRAMLQNLTDDPAIQSKQAVIDTQVSNSIVPTLLLAVEDARILCGRLERVEALYRDGVRILTPLWSGVTCMGGSHDTDVGLTDFGKSAIEKAVCLGMIPDISHASEQSADDIFQIATTYNRPVIASHSNSYTLCPVSRNLRDGQIRDLLRCDGVIGINLYQNFLKKCGTATVEDILPHIEYFLEQGAEKNLCIGGDWDGAKLPKDLPDLSALPRLAEKLVARNYSEELIQDLFFGNAFRFATKYIHS